jgi:hypothetical protein
MTPTKVSLQTVGDAAAFAHDGCGSSPMNVSSRVGRGFAHDG